MNLHIGSSSGGTLNLSRLALQFEDHETVRIAGQDEKLTAVAEINYTGAGLLDAVWEVADPTSTFGDPVFIKISVLRQYLGTGHTAVLQSPPLPTASVGEHIVRLRINQPVIAGEPPVLVYYINKQSGKNKVIAGEIIINDPPLHTRLVPGTEFRWQEVEGAVAYQFEIHSIDNATPDVIPKRDMQTIYEHNEMTYSGNQPVTGILLPAQQTSVIPLAHTLERLQHDHKYQWRVIAINPDGEVIAVSEMRVIEVQ